MIHMVEREGQTLNRNDLLSCVGGYSHQAQSRTLDTHMKRLRQKLAPYADCIETVRSIGDVYKRQDMSTLKAKKFRWLVKMRGKAILNS